MLEKEMGAEVLVSRDISYSTFYIWSSLAKTDRTKKFLVVLGTWPLQPDHEHGRVP